MAKLTLQPEPVFRAPVPVPVPGGETVDVVFHFQFKDQQQLNTFLKGIQERDDVDVLLEICCGWDDIDQEFSRESLELFDRNWHGGARAVFATYIKELRGVRAKN